VAVPVSASVIVGTVRSGAPRSPIWGEQDAQVVCNTRLEKQLAGELDDVQAEIVRINRGAARRSAGRAGSFRSSPGLTGLFNSFRMMRLLDPTRTSVLEGEEQGRLTPFWGRRPRSSRSSPSIEDHYDLG
jgi:hypothetical protein